MSAGEFEQLARPLLPALYGTAMRLSRNEADAGDLVQETVLRAFRTFANFRPGTNARAWLFTILHSVYVNHCRRSGRERARFSLLGEDLDQAIAAESMALYAEDDLAVSYGDWSAQIDRALEQLPESFRLVVLMVDVDELSYEEVATVLDCPVGTVRSRLFRGRRALCALLRGTAEQAGILKADSREIYD